MERTITVFGQSKNAAAIATDRNNKEAKFKNCAPFTHFENEINNIQVDIAQSSWCCDIDYYLIEYSDSYWKTSACIAIL